MADRAKKISELGAITANSVANTDLFVVVDTSASETKKMAASEVASYIKTLNTPIGPFDTDGAAASSVAIGGLYYTSAGVVKIRLS